MNNIFLYLLKFSFFDLLFTKLETENHPEQSGLGCCQVGVTFRFFVSTCKANIQNFQEKKQMNR